MNDKGGRMVLHRAPNLMYFVQRIGIPSIRIGTVSQWSPMDQLPWPGDTLYREDFVVRFKVDEDMTNYLEVSDWMVRSVAPNSPEQYRSLVNGKKGQRASDLFSDVTVTVPTSGHAANVEIRLEDAFPVSLSGMDYVTTGDDVGYLDATVSFRFRHFTVHRM